MYVHSHRKQTVGARLNLLETVTGQLALAIENAQLYEASHRHAVELEQIVAERTRELAHAKERAEAADHIKSAFLATMSHELRTPLNSIIGFTGIILQGLAGPLNPEQTKQLEMVRSSSRHLLALINDVLDISKIEAGQLEVASERFDLRASINKVVGIVAPLAEKKGLALRAQIVPELGEAVGDQRRVEQILLNLLNNAIKFTDSGEVALKTELIPDFKSPEWISGQPAVRLCVSDTGIGIKPDDLTTLFQPFRQIESGLSRNYEGTGLGLAICRRLADLMGGDISAESTWTKGSTFSFTFPLQGSKQIMKARILLIEDNEQNRYLLTFLLEQRGHEVVPAVSGSLGLELAAKVSPDLILLDIQLPGMDGYAVARALKSDPRLKSIPIVAVTSYAMVGDREKVLAAGAEGYIEKPINPETFVAEIDRFLRSPGEEATP